MTEAGTVGPDRWWAVADFERISDEWDEREDRELRRLIRHAAGPDVVEAWAQLGRQLITSRGGQRRDRIGAHAPDGPGDPNEPEHGTRPRTDLDPAQIRFRFQVLSVVSSMLHDAEQAEDQDTAAANVALVWLFLYLQALIVWEYTDDPLDRIVGVIGSLELAGSDEVLRRMGAQPEGDRHREYLALLTTPGAGEPTLAPLPDHDPTGAGHLAWAAVRLLIILRGELRTENALYCSCPDDFTRQATRVAVEATKVRDVLDRYLEATTGEAGSPTTPIQDLLGLLAADARAVATYWAYLGHEVGPAARQFVEALWSLAPIGATADRLGRAADAGAAPERALGRDVLSTEVRAHRHALRSMQRALATRPAIRVTQGEIALLFPFGLPDTDADRLIDRLLQPGAGTALPWLLGLPVTIEATRQTDSWENWDNLTVADRRNRSVTIRFPDHRVVLETTEPALVHDVDLCLVINSLGNHFVRVNVCADDDVERPDVVAPDDPAAVASTPDQVQDVMATWSLSEPLPAPLIWRSEVDAESGDQDARRDEHGVQDRDGDEAPDVDGDGEELIGWTGHEIDQWVRRATYQVGTERIRFVDTVSGTSEPRPVAGSFIQLARAIIDDFAPKARRAAPAARLRTTQRGESVGRDPFNNLHIGAHVVVQIERAVRRDGDGWTPVESPSELPELLGSSSFLLPQRPLPSALEEWCRLAPAPIDNLLDDVGLPNDLITRNRDVTVLCMFDSPNWAVITFREIVEFAASVAGVHAAWSNWLRSVGRESAEVVRRAVADEKGRAKGDTEERLRRLQVQIADIALNISEVRSILGHFRSDQLVRAGSERALMNRLLDAGGLGRSEQALHDNIEALTASSTW